MKQEEEKLIRIRSEGEIRIGAMYILSHNMASGHSERFMILSRRSREQKCSVCKSSCRSYISTLPLYEGRLCVVVAIEKGTLFRIEDGLNPEKDELTRIEDELLATLRSLGGKKLVKEIKDYDRHR